MRILTALFLSFFLTACAGGVSGEKHVNLQPTFDLKEFFTGDLRGWGIVQDRSGNVIKQFDVDLVGTWNGNEGVLAEEFNYYDDDEPQYRTWYITKNDDGTYTGKASDIIDQATGIEYGNAVNWAYQMDIPVGDKTYRLTLDDWMWAMEDGVVINRTYMKKFGITFAELTLIMKKM